MAAKYKLGLVGGAFGLQRTTPTPNPHGFFAQYILSFHPLIKSGSWPKRFFFPHSARFFF